MTLGASAKGHPAKKRKVGMEGWGGESRCHVHRGLLTRCP